MNLRLFGSFSLTKVVRWGLMVAVALSIQARTVADSVTEWNERALACTVAAKQLPYAATRAMAMVHVAMFDAANSVEHLWLAEMSSAESCIDSFLTQARTLSLHLTKSSFA